MCTKILFDSHHISPIKCSLITSMVCTQELEVIEGIRVLLSQKVSEGFDQLW